MQNTFDDIQKKSSLLSFGITSVLPSEAYKKRKNTVLHTGYSHVNKLKNFNIFINANAWTVS